MPTVREFASQDGKRLKLIVPDPAVDESLALLRAVPGYSSVNLDEPEDLRRAVRSMRSAGRTRESAFVSESLLHGQLRSLDWRPLAGARFVLEAIHASTPSRSLLQDALVYLSLYFQELDDVIRECRGMLRAGEPLAQVAAALASAVTTVEGVSVDGQDEWSAPQ